ncbi:toxin Cry1Ac domain D-VI-related protein [Bacillus cytotoxicus]
MDFFGDESHSILHNETSKTEIDATKEKVSQLPDNSNKTELLNEIKKSATIAQGTGGNTIKKMRNKRLMLYSAMINTLY